MCQFIDDFWVKIIEIRLKMIQKKKKNEDDCKKDSLK